MKPAADTHSRAVIPAPSDQQPRQPASELPGTATVPGYAGTFDGRAGEAARVRREIAAYLAACPAADDMILIASELAANAVLHTHSRAASFMVRCQASPGQVRIEVEDLGGPWRQRRDPGDRPHGLDIISTLTGPDGWGTQAAGTGGRIVWAQLSW
jgi:serine/threonine-protein kinase RsbW